MYENKRKGQGYIEIMVVVAVLLVITLFAIPRYQNLRRDAYRAQIANDSKLVEAYVIEHYFYTGEMPVGSKIISNSGLRELVDSKRSYIKAGIINSTDIDTIGGEKYLLDKEDVLKHVNTKLKGDFVYTDSGVVYIDSELDNNDSNISFNGEAWDKYKTNVNGGEITVLGFKENYDGDKSNIEDIIKLEKDGLRIVSISDNAFIEEEFKGKFPELQHIKYIGSGAFQKSTFSGKLILPNVEIIGKVSKSNFSKGAFENSNFIEIIIPNIKTIGDMSFYMSTSLTSLPELDQIENIGAMSFHNSELKGSFLKGNNSNNLQYIGMNAFYSSNFQGRFPILPKLEFIGSGAFFNSEFEGQLNLPKVKVIGSVDSEYELGSFSSSNFSEINIPAIKKIGDSVFDSCLDLKDMPFMPLVEEVGHYAFGSSKLSGTFGKHTNLYFIGTNAFGASQFSDIPNDFYKGWNGKDYWKK